MTDRVTETWVLASGEVPCRIGFKELVEQGFSSFFVIFDEFSKFFKAFGALFQLIPGMPEYQISATRSATLLVL